MKYLNWNLYEKNALLNKGNHWKSYEDRWPYHQRSVEIVKTLNLNDPKKVLEMGTVGASIVRDCETIDFEQPKSWQFKGEQVTIIHDARNIPWPIEDKAYDLFVALRVFHHLSPFQKECFSEALRIARNVIIVVPTKVNNDNGITFENFVEWNNGQSPDHVELVSGSKTFLYLWKNANSKG